jgi:hypothetical protein
MFDRQTHYMPLGDMQRKPHLVNILVVDVGIAHASVILNILTDRKNVYVAKEWYQKGIVVSRLAQLVGEARQWSFETFGLPIHRMIIDPSSSKREQTSGTSVREDLRRSYSLRFDPANNNVMYGIQAVQDLIMSAKGVKRLYFNTPECYNLANEMEIYRWKEPRELDTDHMEYQSEPVKKRDDAVDALRYGVCYLKRHLEVTDEEIEKKIDEVKKKNWENRFTKLKLYQEEPALMGLHLLNDKRNELTQTYRRLGFSKKRIKSLISGIK